MRTTPLDPPQPDERAQALVAVATTPLTTPRFPIPPPPPRASPSLRCLSLPSNGNAGSTRTATPLRPARTTPRAGCLTSGPTASSTPLSTTTSSAVSPRLPSPSQAASSLPATTTTTATSGILSRFVLSRSKRERGLAPLGRRARLGEGVIEIWNWVLTPDLPPPPSLQLIFALVRVNASASSTGMRTASRASASVRTAWPSPPARGTRAFLSPSLRLLLPFASSSPSPSCLRRSLAADILALDSLFNPLHSPSRFLQSAEGSSASALVPVPLRSFADHVAPSYHLLDPDLVLNQKFWRPRHVPPSAPPHFSRLVLFDDETASHLCRLSGKG